MRDFILRRLRRAPVITGLWDEYERMEAERNAAVAARDAALVECDALSAQRDAAITEYERPLAESPRNFKEINKFEFDHVYTVSQLDDFVQTCDELGGWGPKTIEMFGDSINAHNKFYVDLGNHFDDSIDPFSEEYFQRQMAVYTKLAGRDFNQSSNEMLFVDADQYVNNHSPRIADLSFIAHHVSTIAAALQVAGLTSGAKILDIGCGTGLSSEIMAFCGAQITAIDINPIYIDIVNRRAARLGLPITASSANILDYAAWGGGEYDAVLFFESLHHIPKPWELLPKLSTRMKNKAKIIVAGEPISFPSFQRWWTHWGVRLSAEDVYVARKRGWYETGFSEDFLRMMFTRAGYAMHTACLDRSIVGGGRIDIAVKLD